MAKNTESKDADERQVSYFENYLRKKAPSYFENFESGKFCISLMSSEMRPASRLYRYHLRANGWNRSVFIKVPLRRQGAFDGLNMQDGGSSIERPRLAPLTPSEIKSELEYTALLEIFEYFRNIDDARFAAVRVLDYIQQRDAIVMEEVDLPSLNQLFLKSSRFLFGLSSDNLDEAFRNAGAWLRIFHKLPRKENVKARHKKRSDFTDSVHDFAKFLGGQLEDEEYFKDLANDLETASLRTLPKSLPIGLAHGDFAMRNILVGHKSQVRVVDTLARWRTPIFEDIGYFLAGLKSTSLQVVTRGFAFGDRCLERYEREFLSGYFHEEAIPKTAIRLFEAQALLDKWSARLADIRGASSKVAFKLFSFNQFFKSMLNRIKVEIQ